MSTKTSPDKFFFLLVSFLLHAGLLWLFVSPVGLRLLAGPVQSRNEPFFVEVVELPPDAAGEPVEPERVTRYADRAMKVKKESVPDERPVAPPRVRTASPASVPTGGVVRRKGRAEGNKGGKGEEVNRGTTAGSGTKPVRIPGSGGDALEEGDAGAGRSQAGPLRLFPSKERLAQLAEPEAPAARRHLPQGGQKGRRRFALNASELKDHRYLLDLKRKLDLFWEYPASSIRDGEQGRLRVDFTVERDGSIKNIRIIKSSGYPALDDAAVTALRLSSPLNPLPESYQKDRLTVHVQFEYKLIYM